MSAIYRTPQEFRTTDSKSESKTATSSTHRITNGHDHQVSFPYEFHCIYFHGSIATSSGPFAFAGFIRSSAAMISSLVIGCIGP
ncbi:hypothetical protein Y032_0242g3452 [Ancylostoma ceylanicum]|uniref:Uncharacterized protein n=1 Tax=Ancylostoma ceylanicum TaxID=53326 RepID=A0A016SEP7_9BILA|nr:hypothetical protein Y032_0242g3452 [Ancylostoma ceylanicum]